MIYKCQSGHTLADVSESKSKENDSDLSTIGVIIINQSIIQIKFCPLCGGRVEMCNDYIGSSQTGR